MFVGNNPYTTHPNNVTPPVGTDATFQFLFDGNTNETTGNYSVTVNGTPAYGTGPNANNLQSINCDGSQYIDIAASADFSVTYFTIAFWIKRASFPSGFDAIFEHDRSGNNWYGVYTDSTAGHLNFRVKGLGGNDDVSTSATWNTGQWYHMVFTYNGTTGTVYRDGTSIVNTALDPGTTNLDSIRLFRNQDNGENFQGEISRLEFWNTSKDSSEVATIYSNAQ